MWIMRVVATTESSATADLLNMLTDSLSISRTSTRLLPVSALLCPMVRWKMRRSWNPKRQMAYCICICADCDGGCCAKACQCTPFVWKRDDGTHAVVQTWPTDYNEKFKPTILIQRCAFRQWQTSSRKQWSSCSVKKLSLMRYFIATVQPRIPNRFMLARLLHCRAISE